MNKYLLKIAGPMSEAAKKMASGVASKFAMGSRNRLSEIYSSAMALRGSKVHSSLAKAMPKTVEKVRHGSMLEGKKFGLSGPESNRALSVGARKARMDLHKAMPTSNGLAKVAMALLKERTYD